MTENKSADFASLPPLTEDEIDAACFRARDRIWAAIGDLYDQYHDSGKINFAQLGRRIGRTRSQVQRWISAPLNLTFASAGLLAEGLNADLVVELRPRTPAPRGVNHVHPSDDARDFVKATRTSPYRVELQTPTEAEPSPSRPYYEARVVRIKEVAPHADA